MQRIELDNFRVFGAPASFDLAPVTVLTGKNNSGKSSLIKAFLVLADYLEQDDQTVLRLDGPRAIRHKISSFEQLTNWDNEHKQLSFGFHSEGYQLSFQFAETLDSFAARLTSFKLVITANQDELALSESSQTDQSYHLRASQSAIDYIANAEAYLYEQRKIFRYEAEQQRKRLAGIEEQIERKKTEFDKNPDLLKFQAVASAFAELNKQREDALKRIRQCEEAATSSQPKRDGILYQAEIKAGNLGANDRKLARLIQQALIDYVEADATRKNSSTRYGKEEQLRNLLRFGQELNQLLRLAIIHIGPNRTYQARLFFNY